MLENHSLMFPKLQENHSLMQYAPSIRRAANRSQPNFLKNIHTCVQKVITDKSFTLQFIQVKQP